jgi:hypothetical protein
VPPARADAARVALARVRAFCRREYGLSLRVGLVAVASIRSRGADVRVGRYEPAPGNSFGVFLGGGVALLEASLKGRADSALAAEAAVTASLEDGEMPDITGLSCRWDELRSARGQMVSLIVSGARDPGGIHRLLLDIASRGGDARPVRLDNLKPRWPPKGLLVEARAQRRRGPLALAIAAVLVKSLAAKAALSWNGPIGSFDPAAYKAAITKNTDFSKCDDVLSLVLDCDEAAIAEIRGELEARAAAGELRYGMHLAPTALMTCLVTSLADHQHVHFVDGGNGGYARAAQGLKAVFGGSAA